MCVERQDSLGVQS